MEENTNSNNAKKEEMLEKVKKNAEEITGQLWRKEGGCIISEDNEISINVYDHIGCYRVLERENSIRNYVSCLIQEEKAGMPGSVYEKIDYARSVEEIKEEFNKKFKIGQVDTFENFYNEFYEWTHENLNEDIHAYFEFKNGEDETFDYFHSYYDGSFNPFNEPRGNCIITYISVEKESDYELVFESWSPYLGYNEFVDTFIYIELKECD